jgi:hypothetical protein
MVRCAGATVELVGRVRAANTTATVLRDAAVAVDVVVIDRADTIVGHVADVAQTRI